MALPFLLLFITVMTRWHCLLQATNCSQPEQTGTQELRFPPGFYRPVGALQRASGPGSGVAFPLQAACGSRERNQLLQTTAGSSSRGG